MGYCVVKFDFVFAVFVSEVFSAIFTMPILLVSGFGNGCVLCRNLFKIMICAVKLAVFFAAGIANC